MAVKKNIVFVILMICVILSILESNYLALSGFILAIIFYYDLTKFDDINDSFNIPEELDNDVEWADFMLKELCDDLKNNKVKLLNSKKLIKAFEILGIDEDKGVELNNAKSRI